MSRRFPNHFECINKSEYIKSVKIHVDTVIEQIRQISRNQVDYATKELDSMMSNLYDIMNTQSTIASEDLERYILKLANVLYFTVAQQEQLGIKEDVSKLIRQELYSEVKRSTVGTVADKEATAVIESQYEEMVQIIYSRAYKDVKCKVDAGYEMLNALKKIMNARLSEMELSKSRYIGGTENEPRERY